MKSKFFWTILILVISFSLITSGILLADDDVEEGTITRDDGNRSSGVQPDDKLRIGEQVEDIQQYDPQPSAMKSNMYKLVIDAFERAGEWRGEMPRDEGYITVKRVFGSPRALAKGETNIVTPPSKDKSTYDVMPKYKTKDGSYEARYFEDINFPQVGKGSDKNTPKVSNLRILGVKVHFFKRGHNHFAVYPPKPIFIEGITKGFELWVCGRNKNHKLFIMLEDVRGNERIIEVGKLNFLGWKKMQARVSPRIEQADYRFNQQRGITFKGFLIQCDPMDSYGKYYLYTDNLVAVVDRFFEENRDIYDPSDRW